MEIDEKTLEHFEKLSSELEGDKVENFDLENELLMVYIRSNPLNFSKREWWTINNSLNDCESPIEQMLLIGIVNLIVHGITGIEIVSDDVSYEDYKIGSPDELVIYPQAKVGEYRVDFRVKYIEYQGLHKTTGGHYVKELIIECDGHEFHERTKEQAQKDKKRDRDLSALGYTVLRFTGSEIWVDPFKCAEEILQFLQRKR